ncbi:MAG TPA: YdcF family protein, partial [Pyrinomonadaceae bacterium]|nr:YdcF family protein [Pyrinomonadaceae bacterium]
ERTRFAAKLLNEGRAPRIILTNDNQDSGWSAEEERNPKFVERAADELKQNGVPAEKIEIIPAVVWGTHDEVVRIRQYASEHKLQSILVVTSAYQSRRALWTLRRVFSGSGIEIGLDAVEPGAESPSRLTWWRSSLGWKMVPGEYLKLVYYWLKY